MFKLWTASGRILWSSVCYRAHSALAPFGSERNSIITMARSSCTPVREVPLTIDRAVCLKSLASRFLPYRLVFVSVLAMSFDGVDCLLQRFALQTSCTWMLYYICTSSLPSHQEGGDSKFVLVSWRSKTHECPLPMAPEKINQQLRRRLGTESPRSTTAGIVSQREEGTHPSLLCPRPISMFSDDEDVHRLTNPSSRQTSWPEIIHHDKRYRGVTPRGDSGEQCTSHGPSRELRRTRRGPGKAAPNSHFVKNRHSVDKSDSGNRDPARNVRDDLEEVKRSLCATMFGGEKRADRAPVTFNTHDTLIGRVFRVKKSTQHHRCSSSLYAPTRPESLRTHGWPEFLFARELRERWAGFHNDALSTTRRTLQWLSEQVGP